MKNTTLTAIIVDDEKRSIALLRKLLINTGQVKILGCFVRPTQAIEEISNLKPDILFLDIQMPLKNGFEVADEIRTITEPPYIVFITAYEKYAINAIKSAAFDYLLKPVNPDELNETLNRIRKTAGDKSISLESKLQHLFKQLNANLRLKFNTTTGFIIIDTREIVYLEANRNYCLLFLTDETSEVLTMNMNHVDSLLPETSFYRISRSHIVNVEFLRKVERRTSTCILKTQQDTIQLPISPRNARLLEKKYFGKDDDNGF